MHPAGRGSYPVSTRLRVRFRVDPTFKDHQDLVDAALEYIGEYEHGSVDVKDLLGFHGTVEKLADVIFDFVGVTVMAREA
jgi:hypothetical protein